MKKYEVIPKMSKEQIANILFQMVKPFLEGDEEKELEAKIKIMSMLEEDA